MKRKTIKETKKETKEEKKVLIAKTIVVITAGCIAGLAVSAVTMAAVKNVVPFDDLTKMNKVIYGFGIAVIGSIAGQAGSNYVGEIANGVVNTIEKVNKIINLQFEKSKIEIVQ